MSVAGLLFLDSIELLGSQRILFEYADDSVFIR